MLLSHVGVTELADHCEGCVFLYVADVVQDLRFDEGMDLRLCLLAFVIVFVGGDQSCSVG